ncbi:MAG TPA: cyclic nucleotide-binding domain-containing protein, partial [Polyangiaceae bacterium]|nr:cyclic nucleotide-binding domain-containing protein [Polyangiaceae bacterium]
QAYPCNLVLQNCPGEPSPNRPSIARWLCPSLANATQLCAGGRCRPTRSWMPSGLLLCGRLLAETNRLEIAREALEICLYSSIDAGNLPLAVAACSDLRNLGTDPDPLFDAIALAFGLGSSRLQAAAAPPILPQTASVQPLPSVLTGMALVNRTADILRTARKARKDLEHTRHAAPPISPVALFSDLDPPSLRALIEQFEVMSVPKDALIIQEGDEGAEAYIVARGELEAIRTVDDQTTVLARLTAGSLFGEMALLSRAPRAASVIACRPSILLVARKDALDQVAVGFPSVGTVLASHCQRRMVQNLIRTSAILRAVGPDERPALIERFVTRTFEPGEILIEQGETAAGLHLIASGEVSVSREENEETLVLASLGPGDIVGEVSLVLRKPSTARVTAKHATLCLHLPTEDFLELIREHPAILAELYDLAVRRDEETSTIVAQEVFDVDDALLI